MFLSSSSLLSLPGLPPPYPAPPTAPSPDDTPQDPLSEERFHVELHFSPGVKGVEEEGSAPTGYGFRPASSENEEMKTDQGSMENLCPGKASDEPDRALQTSPQPSEGPGLPRKSPLIRNRKAGSMEVMNMQCTGNLDLIPLRGRRRRRSGDLPRPSPAIGLQPRAVSTTHLASCTQVLSETSSSRPGGYRLFSSSRPPTEMKQSGLGFEGCSMVPTIYPLETLHNALSLRQVSEFLSNVCQRHTDAQAQVSAALFDSMHSNQASDSQFSPPRTLHSPTSQLRQRSEKPPWYSSGPSSTVSSAGPSSPTAVDGNCHFGFSDQSSLRSLVSEERQSLGLLQEAPGNGAQELPIEGEQESFEPNLSPQEAPVETSQPCQEVAEEVNQTCQQVPDVSQPCQDIPEEASQPCQEVPDSSQPCKETHDDQTLQEVPQLYQKASQLCQKVSEEACQLYQEIPEELSQPCPEFSVEVGRLAPEPSAINPLSQDIPEVDTPSQEFPEESDVQLQEVPAEVNQQSWVVPEVTDQLPREGVPQAQYPSGDPNPQSQSLAPDQNSPHPPATCD